MNLREFFSKILKPYRFYLLFLAITGVMWGLSTSLSPYLLKLIIDDLAASKPIHQIYWPGIAYVVLFFSTALNFRAYDWVVYQSFPLIKKKIAMSMFNYIKYHSHDFFQNHFAGSMSNKVNDMVVNIEALLRSTDEFFANFMSFLIAIVVMYTVNPLFSLALFLWWITFFTVSILFSKTIHFFSTKTSEAYSVYSGTLVDIFSNISSVRLFSRFSDEAKHLESQINDLVEKEQYTLKYILKMRFIQDSTLVTLLGLMLYLLIHLYEKHQVTIGDFALILSITVSIFHSMFYLGNKIVEVYKNIGKCKQAMTLMEQSHEIADQQHAQPLMIENGQIEFKKVTFAYQNAHPIFSHQNVVIRGGSKVGLVGYSGSGKTTFIHLILRIYDIQSGEICIDGQNIQHVTQNSLRKQISMIPQDISLFHRTLMDNIRYGNLQASEHEIFEAAKKANCHEFIAALEKGYDTLVGERGIKLSGGQRQRIAIARAFLENAPILILDEATSSLDSVTEKYIQESLALAIQHRTTIVIAHRLSTLLQMDRILVFNHGKIIEDGSHDTLIQLNGHYANMWNMQSNGFLPNNEHH